jgi:hypothetical protein
MLKYIAYQHIDNISYKLYGTGAMQYDPATQTVSRVGGIKYTIKNGVVYDAPGLPAEVRRMVAASESTSSQIR